MKTLNTHWKLIAFGTIAVMMTIWAGSRMEAKTGQDYTTQSARVSPQVREAAINALGPIGITRGQTLRIGLLVPGPHVVSELTIFDCAGNTLMNTSVDPTNPHTCPVFDLNADQLPQQLFDNAGRIEMNVELKSGGDVNKPGFSVSAQVFDNLTGKTTFALQAGGHTGGVN